MFARTARDKLWPVIRAERAALAADLTGLDDARWTEPSLCGQWTVEDVVAHLTAAASIGPLRWLTSAISARFDFDVHNARRLAEHRGSTPAQTLKRFREVIDSTTAPLGPTVAWLGEVVVHAQDIRQPLGVDRVPAADVVTPVAQFYAKRNFAVASRTAIAGLRLEATDGSFATGEGPLVAGTTLALTMVMAGRSAYCNELSGPGVQQVRARCCSADDGPPHD
jgi:uncharacterized protein (TIGR03083 family)